MNRGLFAVPVEIVASTVHGRYTDALMCNNASNYACLKNTMFRSRWFAISLNFDR